PAASAAGSPAAGSPAARGQAQAAPPLVKSSVTPSPLDSAETRQKCAPRRWYAERTLPRLIESKGPASAITTTIMTNTRRSDFDVTDTVQVSSPEAVLAAVESLYAATWPQQTLDPLRLAFEHFER